MCRSFIYQFHTPQFGSIPRYLCNVFDILTKPLLSSQNDRVPPLSQLSITWFPPQSQHSMVSFGYCFVFTWAYVRSHVSQHSATDPGHCKIVTRKVKDSYYPDPINVAGAVLSYAEIHVYIQKHAKY